MRFFLLNDQKYFFSENFANTPNIIVYVPQTAYRHFMYRNPQIEDTSLLPQNIVETFGYTNTFIINLINDKLAEADYNIENIDSDILNEFYHKEIVAVVNEAIKDSQMIDTLIEHIQQQNFGKDLCDFLLTKSTNLIVDEMIDNNGKIDHLYFVVDSYTKAKSIFDRQQNTIKKSTFFVDFFKNVDVDNYIATFSENKIVLKNQKSNITYQLVIATYLDR